MGCMRFNGAPLSVVPLDGTRGSSIMSQVSFMVLGPHGSAL